MKLDTIAVFFSRLIARGSIFLVLAIFANFLPINDLGYYGLVSTSAYTVVYFVSLGLRHASAYFIGKSVNPESQIITALSIFGLLVGVVTAFGANLFYSQLNNDIEFRSFSVLSSALILPLLWTFLFQGVFLGRGEIQRFNLSELMPRLLLLFIVSTMALFGAELDLRGALFAFLISSILGAVYATWHAWQPIMLSDILNAPRLLWPMVKYGFPLALALAFVLLSPTVSIYTTKMMIGPEAVGLFFLTYKVTDIVAEAATATGMVAFSRGVRSRNKRRALFGALRSAWMVAGLALVVGLGLGVFGDWMMRLMLAKNVANAGTVMAIVAGSLPFLCFSRILNPALAAQGYGISGAWIQGLSVLINGLLAVLLALILGLEGIALALALSRVLNALAFSTVIAQVLNVNLRRVLIPNRHSRIVIFGRIKNLVIGVLGGIFALFNKKLIK